MSLEEFTPEIWKKFFFHNCPRIRTIVFLGNSSAALDGIWNMFSEIWESLLRKNLQHFQKICLHSSEKNVPAFWKTILFFWGRKRLINSNGHMYTTSMARKMSNGSMISMESCPEFTRTCLLYFNISYAISVGQSSIKKRGKRFSEKHLLPKQHCSATKSKSWSTEPS